MFENVYERWFTNYESFMYEMRNKFISIIFSGEQNHSDVHTFIPYSTIYHDRDGKQTFLPGTTMIARVVEVERSSVFNHPFNPNL